jgi:methionine biosynthesis protein MetW
MGLLRSIFEATEEENRRVILSLAEPRPGGRLLDLGCGDGSLTVRVAQAAQAAEVHGVEFVEHIAAAARARGVEVAAADLGRRLPYDDASFDVVHSNQVIEHLPHTDAFMREIRRLLKPEGYAIVSTNNLASWHNVASLVVGWQPAPCHVSDEIVLGNPVNFAEGDASPTPGQTHLRVFTGRALAALAAHHGLRADRLLGAGYYPLPAAVARPLARLDARHAAFLVHRYARA